jgi:hypothetical protein
MLRAWSVGLALWLGATEIAMSAERHMALNFQNMSSANAIVQITPDASGVVHQFTNKTPKEFEYDLKLSDREWFYRVPITIIWLDAYVSHGKPLREYRQRIVLRMRRDIPAPPLYKFKMYFSNDRSDEEMRRLEKNIDTSDGDLLSELYLRGQQIAEFYSDAPGAGPALKRRAAQLWYEGAIQLAELPRYFVEVSEDAVRLARQTKVDPAGIDKRVVDAQSMYWEDLELVEKMIDDGNCDGATVMLAALRDRKNKEKVYFDARKRTKRTSDELLEETERTLTRRCSVARQ